MGSLPVCRVHADVKGVGLERYPHVVCHLTQDARASLPLGRLGIDLKEAESRLIPH